MLNLLQSIKHNRIIILISINYILNIIYKLLKIGISREKINNVKTIKYQHGILQKIQYNYQNRDKCQKAI